MLYHLLICLSVSLGNYACDPGQVVRVPYDTRQECLAAFQRIKDEAPRMPARMYCVTIARVTNA